MGYQKTNFKFTRQEIEIVINMKESIIRTRDHIENVERDPNISSERMNKMISSNG